MIRANEAREMMPSIINKETRIREILRNIDKQIKDAAALDRNHISIKAPDYINIITEKLIQCGYYTKTYYDEIGIEKLLIGW